MIVISCFIVYCTFGRISCRVIPYSAIANWAQFAGERAQNTATPYIPDKWHREKGTSIRPMWSARWGHAVVVLNQSIARSYLTEEENSEFARDANPVLVLLGGDDGLPRDIKNMTTGEFAVLCCSRHYLSN